jgi:hypothetical protein
LSLRKEKNGDLRGPITLLTVILVIDVFQMYRVTEEEVLLKYVVILALAHIEDLHCNVIVVGGSGP